MFDILHAQRYLRSVPMVLCLGLLFEMPIHLRPVFGSPKTPPLQPSSQPRSCHAGWQPVPHVTCACCLKHCPHLAHLEVPHFSCDATPKQKSHLSECSPPCKVASCLCEKSLRAQGCEVQPAPLARLIEPVTGDKEAAPALPLAPSSNHLRSFPSPLIPAPKGPKVPKVPTIPVPRSVSTWELCSVKGSKVKHPDSVHQPVCPLISLLFCALSHL